ncbi:efflux transporter outer membrane subunit [Paraburkholderia humisilvae]|nr:efflux transporter outer membrane subunit [Paraburkholderia humisilvae]
MPLVPCVAMLATLLLSACALGPDFRPPAAPQVARYTAAPMPELTVDAPGPGGTAQRFAIGADIPAAWWTLLRCEPLDTLIRDALAQSPNIAAAQAALRQASETWHAQFGDSLLPRVDGQLSAQREKINGIAFGQPNFVEALNLYNASVNVSYDLDLFGGARRLVEASKANVDVQNYQLRAAYLTLTSNIVTAAVREASLRAQIEAIEEIAGDQQRQLALLDKQFAFGGTSRSAVLLQQTQLAQTRARTPPLSLQLDQVRHELAALAGRLPSDAHIPEFRLEMFTLPDSLPVSVPSALVRQRPDILASEALLHQASAQVGVATAALYPQISLTASYGTSGVTPADLFSAAGVIWSIGAGLAQPIFHGGALRAKKRAAEAAYEQASAQYRETVLQGFQNVADSLRALEHDAAGLRTQTDAWSSARNSLSITREQYRLGAVDYLALLDAQRQYLNTTVDVAQARAARFADTAALFQSLGGGWWNADEPMQAAVRPAEEPLR